MSNTVLCISWVSLADFAGFIYKVITRQMLKLTRGFEFSLVAVATLLDSLPCAKEKCHKASDG